MGRRIELRVDYTHPAQRVLVALTDETALRERLAAIGGRSSELVSHRVDGGTTAVVMRQGIDAEHLPGVVRRVTPDGVTIQRTETWAAGDGTGTVEASVSGFSGSLRGTTSLTDTGPGSQLLLTGEVKVSIPLIGGKIEGAIADQLDRLLQAEATFTNRWLDDHPA